MPRARALLDPPGPQEGAVVTAVLILVAIAVALFRAARRILRHLEEGQ